MSSAGSIAYAGALSHNDFDNAIAKLSWNVLRRFADQRRFKIIAAGASVTRSNRSRIASGIKRVRGV